MRVHFPGIGTTGKRLQKRSQQTIQLDVEFLPLHRNYNYRFVVSNSVDGAINIFFLRVEYFVLKIALELVETSTTTTFPLPMLSCDIQLVSLKSKR